MNENIRSIGGEDLVFVLSCLRLGVHTRHSHYVDPIYIQTLLTLADYTLVSTLFDENYALLSSSRSKLAEVVMLAAHLFLYVSLREMPTASALVRKMNAVDGSAWRAA